MTNIKLEKIGSRYYVDVSGHSNYDVNGKDIVCAGVSTLVQTFILYLEEIEDIDRCNIIELEMNDDEILIIVDGEESYISPCYEMLRLGLTAIAEIYPKNVTITE